MLATRYSTSDQSRSTAPYRLAGASKPRLAAFTVAALKSPLKRFKLSTTGIKAGLVDPLHSHLHSLEETGINNLQVSDTSDSQTHAPFQGNNASGSHVVDTSNPSLKEVVPAHKLVIPAPRNGIRPHKETLPTTHRPLLPLPWTPLRPFILERKLWNYPNRVFVRQLIDNLRQGCAIGYTGPHFMSLAPNLQSAFQQPEVIDETLRDDCEAGQILGPFD